MVEADVTATLRDGDVVEQARTCLADTTSRGSTAEERGGAEAWLVHALRDEHQVEQFHQRTSVRQPAATRATPGPLPAVFARDQLDVLTSQQQRILPSQCVDRLRDAAETRGGQPLALGDALGELLADITEAARTIGTIKNDGCPGLRGSRTSNTRIRITRGRMTSALVRGGSVRGVSRRRPRLRMRVRSRLTTAR
jgi:hypothetical protein